MKKKQWRLLAIFSVLASIMFLSSCNDDDDPVDDEGAVPAATQKVNQFALDVLQDVYLWSSEIPTVDVSTETDPIAMVKRIRNSADHWTTLTDDVAGLNDNFAGEGTSFGYSLGVYLFSNSETDCYAVVQFVYPGTPAEKAGLKRGDIIQLMNGTNITTSNYTNLFYSPTIDLGMANLSDTSIRPNGITVSLTAVDMYQDPVNVYKVIDAGTHKIGYLFYTDYVLKSHAKLLEVFNSFKAEGVTDVVLDLRYNGGGYSLTAQLLSSILAPNNIVASGDQIYLQQTWNDAYSKYWKSQGEDLNEYYKYNFSYENEEGVNESLSVQDANLNGLNLYVLVSGGTASASEATITGLSPYMSVKTIGEQTAGKYCGGIVFTPDMIYKSPDKALDNWGIYAMVYRYSDKNGNTPCMPDGFKPTYEVVDNFFDGYSMGDEAEPLLAKALEVITGNISASAKKTRALSFTPRALSGAVNRAGALAGKMIELPRRFEFNK
ncbi:S41 family peptidase [Bacteroides ihuae]|uniref:S41 family peptidase n=1 Tax=Bacteroides ihuae TaxID=1852362 RepID=UPI0008DA1627|nr:S41 family peptidase [Bacteroides ihuae]